eukprot:2496416-Pyramimonas_sp.AAC.1
MSSRVVGAAAVVRPKATPLLLGSSDSSRISMKLVILRRSQSVSWRACSGWKSMMVFNPRKSLVLMDSIAALYFSTRVS